MQFQGTYFDGITSAGQTAQLTADARSVCVSWSGGEQVIGTEDIRVEAALGSVPRRVSWGADDYFISEDHTALDALAQFRGDRGLSYWVSRLEANFSGVAVAVMFTLATLVLFGLYGIPRITASIAHQLPLTVSAQMAQSTMTNLTPLLQESELTESRQQQLRSYFSEHERTDAPAVDVHFRRARSFVGPNALTLSGTTVVFTDAIVELLQNDQQLLAVFLHELGHARMRHVEQTLLQSAGWAVLLTFITGDIGGVGELALTLPFAIGQSAYTREFERQADAFAVAELQRLGIDPEVFAQALEELERSHEGEFDAESGDTEHSDASEAVHRKLLEYLASHPITADRIAAIRGVPSS